MQISAKALGLTFGLLWGAVMLTVGSAALVFPGYGADFLGAMADLYPGFEKEGGIGNVLIGFAWSLGDGLIGGWVVAKVYNLFASGER